MAMRTSQRRHDIGASFAVTHPRAWATLARCAGDRPVRGLHFRDAISRLGPLPPNPRRADATAINRLTSLRVFSLSSLKGNLADDSVAEIAPRPSGRCCHDEGQGQCEAGKVTETLRVAHGTILPTRVRSSQAGRTLVPIVGGGQSGGCPYSWGKEGAATFWA